MKWLKPKWMLIGAAAATAATILVMAHFRLHETPPERTIYLSAGYGDEAEEPLFSIVPERQGYRIVSRRFGCSPTGTTAKKPPRQFPIAAEAEFGCEEYLFALREKGETPVLIGTGFRDLKPPFVIGSGYPVGTRSDEVPRFVFRAPGVGVRHLIARPPAECPSAPTDSVLCAENGGASGSMLLFRAGTAPVRMMHGETQPLLDGDTLWLGYVPFRVHAVTNGKVTLRVVLREHDRSWRTIGGERAWQGLELPSWPLGQRDAVTGGAGDTFVSEGARFGHGHLTEERYEPEQEEQLQLLVDHELLCLDRPAGSPHAVVVWRQPSDPGCVDYGLAVPQRGRRAPATVAALRAYEQVQSEDRFGELLTESMRNLRERVWETDPTSNLFVFDSRYAVRPGTAAGMFDLERAPVALLGVRPRITTTRIRPPKESFPRELAFSSRSTSPALDLEHAPGDPGMLLLLAERTVPPVPMVICTTSAVGALQGPLRPMILALGRVSLRPDGIWWTNATAAAAGGDDCVELTRDGATIKARSRGGVVVTRTPAESTSELPIGTTAVRLTAGDRVRIGTYRFRYTIASDVAAFTLQQGGGRVYPFGADAVTLLGIGSISSGVEGAMSLELRTEIARENRRRQAAALPIPAIELTIDGDMQRALSRELAAAFEEISGSQPAAGERAAAVVLDAETGGVLAVANAPGFDPWQSPQHEALLLQAMRGEVSDDNEFRSRIQNWAFLRHLAIGSTMKVATSIAMQREGLPLSSANNTAGEDCNTLLKIHLAGRRRTDDFSCTHHNPVLRQGAPDPQHWLPAFYGSCNVYFGGSTAMLVPTLGGSIFRSGPEATIPTTFDPARSLAPHEVTGRGQPNIGNGFYETLLLLGHRFDFGDEQTARPQRVKRYRSIEYPTTADPWLSGLEVEAAFAYPTVPAPERYTNVFDGGEPQRRLTSVEVDGRVVLPRPDSQLWMPHYLAVGWGQIMEGSALSIAASGIPTLHSRGEALSPQIFARRMRRRATNRDASILDPEQQEVLRAGFSAVVDLPGGTGYTTLNGMSAFTRSLGYSSGGKTGTIQLEKPATRAHHADVLQRARWWGCGVLGVPLSDAEWQLVRARVSRTKSAALAVYMQPPPWGFAAATEPCRSLNPGLPRVAAAIPPSIAAAWGELQGLEWRASIDRQTNSSAFLAAIWPTRPGTAARRRLIVGVTYDLNAAGSKRATDRIVRELVRLLAVRGE
jgi:cell division protein FtsI/penicillin-binding protein 2